MTLDLGHVLATGNGIQRDTEIGKVASDAGELPVHEESSNTKSTHGVQLVHTFHTIDERAVLLIQEKLGS